MNKNLADIEIPVKFHNYKIFKGDRQFTLKNSYIYFISGPNDTGKTSFKDVFAILQSGKNTIDQPVTRGEDEGFIETKIPGADGRLYLIRHDFSSDKQNKFVAIDEDGKKVSTVTEFRKIFNYTHFTAEEFFLWTGTADGRKRQRDIILNLLGDEARQKYDVLSQDELVTYDERTEKGHEKDQLIKLCQSGKLNEQEQLEIMELAEYKKKLSEIVNAISNTQAFEERRKALVQRKNEIDLNITNIGADLNSHLQTYKDNLEDYNRRINQLEQELDDLKAKRDALQKNYPLEKENRENRLNDLKEELTKVNEELGKLPDYKLEDLNAAKIQYEQKIEAVASLNARSQNLTENTEKRDKAIKEYENFTRKIDNIRAQKKELIAKADLGVSGISIEDDYVMIDGFTFKENQVSKSKAISLVARLMCKINESPIQVIGSANDLDYDALDNLYKIAADNGKIMILDYVDRDASDIAVVGYEPKHLGDIEQKSPSGPDLSSGPPSDPGDQFNTGQQKPSSEEKSEKPDSNTPIL